MMNRRLLKHSFSLLHIDHVHLTSKWNYKNVISPYYRLYYIDEGEGSVSNSQINLKLEPGHLYLIPSYTLCNLHCNAHLSQYFIQFFEESPDGLSLFQHHRTLMKVQAGDIDAANFKRMLQINPGRGINRSDNPKVYEKNEYYREYEELNNRTSDAAYMETQGILLQLLSRFLPASSSTKSEEAIPSKVLDAMSYIQLHLNEALTIAQLAQRANQNHDYFSRVFLQFTGERPLQYIHAKRIERAQYLIATTNMMYAEIATQTGFSSLPHFSRIFKKMTGITPDNYRKQHRLANAV